MVLEEGFAGGVLLEHLNGGGVQGRNTTFGRGEGELCAGFDEGVVGVCELGLAGVSESVLRAEAGWMRGGGGNGSPGTSRWASQSPRAGRER